MTLRVVGQVRTLADIFELLLREFIPKSVAVIGSAGGNCFDRIDSGITQRVVGVGISGTYIERIRARFSGRLRRPELYAGDIQAGTFFRTVKMI